MDTRTNTSTAPNFIDGGKNSGSVGIVLYATAGAVAMLIILVLAVSFRKCRRKQKQQQVCSRSTGHVGEREADCEHGETGREVQSMKKISERSLSTHHPKQDIPTSASTAADCSVHLHIYENICCAKHTACSSHSTGNGQDEHDASSGKYIKPLPCIISQRPGDGTQRKHKNKESRVNKVSGRWKSLSDSTKSRPRSLWFGLDLSGTV
ncbi:CMRF35-like molecule 1 [Scomber scombrus]|uniref:CMRF35-like molecule 1 n=1 Tax=Scomber scombrus TaxID=13677 RepID=A0AAV1P922_SCOSC